MLSHYLNNSCKYGNMGVIQYLINNNIICDPLFKKSFITAVSNEQYEVADYLLKYQHKNTIYYCFSYVIKANICNNDMLSWLIQNDPEIRPTNIDFQNSLNNSDYETSTYLLKIRNNININNFLSLCPTQVLINAYFIHGSESELIKDTCPICLEDKKFEVLSSCNHMFCKQCMEKYVDKKNIKCPICRNEEITYIIH